MTTATPSQRLAALALGQSIRIARATVRAEIGALSYDDGRRRAIELLRDTPPQLGNLAVLDFLTWIRGVRWQGAEKILSNACTLAPFPIAHHRPLAQLAPRQRAALITALGGPSTDVFDGPQR